MDGEGKFVWNNGQTFEGNYKDDKKNGKGKLTLEDKTVIEGTWINGKIEGKGKMTNSKGKVKYI